MLAISTSFPTPVILIVSSVRPPFRWLRSALRVGSLEKSLWGGTKAIADDDYRRMVLRGPEASLRRLMRQHMPQASGAEIDAAVAHAKSQLEADPYALLQPIEPGEAGAQLHSFKGFNLETGMFLASLTGSVIYTDADAHWQQLHSHAQAASSSPSADWASAAEAFGKVEFVIELDGQLLLGALQTGRFIRAKGQLRPLVGAVEQQAGAPQLDQVASQISKAAESHQRAWTKVPIGHRLTGRIELSIPAGGFDRNEVRRLLLTFGRAKVVRPIPLAVLIKFEEVANHTNDPARHRA